MFGTGVVRLNLKGHPKVRDALDELDRRYGRVFRAKTGRTFEYALENTFNVFVNGIRLHLPSDLGRALKEADEIVFLRPVAGGESINYLCWDYSRLVKVW